MLSRRLLLLILLWGLNWFTYGCQSSLPANTNTNKIPIEITRIVSGQTVEGIINDRQYIIRLSGLNAPSFKQKPWGKQAKKFLADSLKNKSNAFSSPISIETDVNKKDKYDRISGYIWIKDKMINEQIIAQGYALTNLTYTDGKYDRQLNDAQLYARIMGKGIWNPDKPLRQLK